MEYNNLYIGIILYYYTFSHFVISSSAELSIVSNEATTLQSVQMIFRHGDKTPERSFPNDPYRNESFWSGGWNHITEKGKRRMYDLGIYFRKRYPGLLSKEYSQDEIYVSSSDKDRTIISASAFLTGLYRDSNLESQWNSDIHWDPIPIRTIEKKHDRYLDVSEKCPQMTKILNNQLYSSEFANRSLADNKQMVDYIANHSGITEINFFTVTYVLQTLQIEEENGLELPSWTKPVLESEPLRRQLMDMHRSLHANNKQWTFFRAGPLTEKLISNMEDFIRTKEENKSDGKKMILFSAHDRTLVDIMLALNIYDPDIKQPPHYGSTLIFELHRDQQNKYFLDILYKNDSAVAPYKMSIPNCGSPCYLTEFKAIVKNFMLGDWETICKQETALTHSEQDADTNSGKEDFGIFLTIIFILGFAITVGGIISMKIY